MAALSLLWRLNHESGHIRHTDFSVLKAANLDPVTFNLFNCLEDWRVEKKLSGIFPGCRRNLNWLIRRFFVEQAQPRAGDDSPALTVLDYVLLTVRAWDVEEVNSARQNAASIMEQHFPGLKETLDAILVKVYMEMIKQYKDYTIGAQAKSFRVYSGFLLHTPPNGDLKKPGESVSETEAELLNCIVVLDEVERSLWLIQQVIKQAISYEEFIEWGQSLGIFKKPKAMSPEASAEQNLALPQADPALSPEKALRLEDVSLYHTMRPENYVLIAGMKGAGKTQVALSCCRAIIQGNVRWPLFAGTGIDAGNVAYIDAETPHVIRANHRFLLKKPMNGDRRKG